MKSTILFLTGLLLFQSCAFLTSFKSYELERGPKSSFNSPKAFTDNFSHTLVFFEDGSFLSIEQLSPEEIEQYLANNNYKIYRKFDDYRFKWGVYKISADAITLELQEKVHQWGLIEVCQWHGTLREKELQILPIERKAKNELDFFTFTRSGKLFQIDEDILNNIKIDPNRSWVNH